MKNLGLIIFAFVISLMLIPMVILGGIKPAETTQRVDKTDASQETKDTHIQQETNNAGTPSEEKTNKKTVDGPKIKVFISEANKIEEMNLEEYIKGVVAGEMPAEFGIEALKSQAVAARTYAVTRMKEFGGVGCSNHQGADICTDSTHCQEWISKEARLKSWSATDAANLWQKVTQAVDETKNQILTYDAQPVMYPLYFSTSSGKTENSQEVFSNSYPYLTSVTSPNEESAPKFYSKTTLTKDEFVKKLSESEYKIKLDKSKLSSLIKILSRTEGGSVKSIKAGSKTLTGMDVRRIFNLNSSNFNIEFGKSDVTFSVTGNGHGVGMSQYGANAMSKEGKKYDEILKHYYQGVSISNIDDVYNKTK